jgi:hypothetical protein
VCRARKRRREHCDDGAMDDTAWTWPELLEEMTKRELTIIADAVYVVGLLGDSLDPRLLADETLLDQLSDDQLLDLKLGLRAQLAQLDAAA